MKSFYLLFMVLAIAAISTAQTTIPNAGFEDWTSAGSYENPDSWDSPNDVTSSLGKIVVEKESSIVHGGSYSAVIKAESSIAGTLPGILTLADFGFDLLSFSATIEGGTPFTGRPYSMKGWVQYEPQNNDICLIGAFLLKENAGSWDTIAIAGFDTTVTLLSWTEFEAIFDYRNGDTPTHLNVILLPADRNNPQANSTLYVDDLSLVYTQSVSDISSMPRITSFQQNELLTIHVDGAESGKVQLSDVNGRRISETMLQEGFATIETSSIAHGVYLITCVFDQNSITQKVVL